MSIDVLKQAATQAKAKATRIKAKAAEAKAEAAEAKETIKAAKAKQAEAKATRTKAAEAEAEAATLDRLQAKAAEAEAEIQALRDRVLKAEAEAAEAKAKQAEAEAAKRPHRADKAAFYEADRDGLARHNGATQKAVTYQALSPEGTLTIALFLLARFGTAAFTAKHAAEEMAGGMLGAGGGLKYQGKDPVGSARINGWQRAHNAVRHNAALAPWVRIGGSGRAEIFRLTEDGIGKLSAWVKAGNPHRWPNS
jgi:hypothetical protein